MDDNATCHRTLAVQDCLDSEGIQRLIWPARSPDLNPIEKLWDALGRQVAGRNYPPTNKNTLIRALTEEWDKLPQQLLDNVVQINRLEYIKLYCRNSNLGHHTGQANTVRGIDADQIRALIYPKKAILSKFLVKEISKFIHRFDLKEDISLYLKLFERQAQRLNIDQENWVSHLLGLLPTEVSHIIAREPDDKANSYEHVKDLLLKRFKLTPEKFRQLFVFHQKAPERTWIDFYHELNTYFNGWIDGLKIDTFNKLADLIITDQLKRKTPFEFKEYYLDEWANMNSPVQLAEKTRRIRRL
ncbi:homeotic protein female sterile [Trichonephila clavipes]|nr:homeotic protein female sterile [Trichonephila clavipes]